MELGKKIAYYRKEKGLTQDALAKRLNISNQAVSKWEANQTYPDISLLTKLADIFEVSMDELFGREGNVKTNCIVNELPWEDDENLRAVVYIGRKLAMKEKLTDEQRKICKEITFVYEGEVLNISSEFSVSCNDVGGNVDAGTSVDCNNVGGSVNAGDGVDCNDVGGMVAAGDGVTCNNVGGMVSAGDSVCCCNVDGDVHAGDNVTCEIVSGNVYAETVIYQN